MAYIESLIPGIKVFIRGRGCIVALTSGVILAIYVYVLESLNIYYTVLSLTITSTISAILMDNFILINTLRGLYISGAPPNFIRRVLLCYGLLLSITVSLPLMITFKYWFKLVTPLLTFIVTYTMLTFMYRRLGKGV